MVQTTQSIKGVLRNPSSGHSPRRRPFVGFGDDMDMEALDRHGSAPTSITPTPRTAGSARSTPHPTPRTSGRSTPKLATPRKSPRDALKKPPVKKRSWETDEWDFNFVEENVQDDEIHNFWEMHWQAAGYIRTEDGEHERRGPNSANFAPPTYAELHEEEQRQHERLDSVKLEDTLAAPGVSASWGALADYARLGEVDKARELLQVAERVGNLSLVINQKDHFGWTAMHWACESSCDNESASLMDRKLKVVKTLVSEYRSSLDLSIRTERGNTALVHAVWNGNVQAVRLLLRKRASDVNAGTEYGWTALHWAANGRRDEGGAFHPLRDVMQLLLRRTYQARVDAVSQGGDAPLHLACMRGSRGIVDMLLMSGADINKANVHGLTPLHVAVTHQQFALVPVLLSWGAKQNAQDRRGRTPSAILAQDTVMAIKLRLHPAYTKVDFQEKQNIDEGFGDWMRERRLNPKLAVASSVEPSDVLALQSNESQQQLLQPPKMLDLDTLDTLNERLAVLRMLCEELGDSAARAPASRVREL